MIYAGKFIRSATPLIFSSTESEASFLGYGLCDALRRVHRWQSSKKIFEAEALNRVGSLMTVVGGNNDTITHDKLVNMSTVSVAEVEVRYGIVFPLNLVCMHLIFPNRSNRI